MQIFNVLMFYVIKSSLCPLPWKILWNGRYFFQHPSLKGVTPIKNSLLIWLIRLIIIFIKVRLVNLFTIPCICPVIKQSKSASSLWRITFLLQPLSSKVHLPRETVNVIEVSAAGILGLQRLWEQQVVPQPVMEVSFPLMWKGKTQCLIALSSKRATLLFGDSASNRKSLLPKLAHF